MFQVLLVVFLTVPLAEIYVFLQVGESIGIGSTIAVVVLTAVTGAAADARPGACDVNESAENDGARRVPATELLEGRFCWSLAPYCLPRLSDRYGRIPVPGAGVAPYFIQMLFAAYLPRPGDHSRGSPSGGRIIEGEVIQDSDRIDC